MTTASVKPLVSVYGMWNETTDSSVKLPEVYKVPLRPELVQWVQSMMMLNSRVPYAVNKYAGHQTSAESWGTGRAVARIPRVRGGGTHRSGQGAFGNMCRGGRMFAPTKTWRRWHRKINKKQRRYAICSAIAGSGIPALVQAKGHIIDGINEVPFVVSDQVQSLKKTKDAVRFLKNVKAYADIEKVIASKRRRAGKGKMRNRRYRQKRGPLIVYARDEGLRKAVRNIPGVETCTVRSLNLLKVAPGGHIGRFIIWTESAFKLLDDIYGTYTEKAKLKKDWSLPKPIMSNTDISRIIRDESIQKAARDRIKKPKKQLRLKPNPLKNMKALFKLNPYAEVLKRKRKVAATK